MKLNIDFGDLVNAFGCSNADKHYFIDAKLNEIIVVDETSDDAQKHLEKMDDKRYLLISPRLPESDLFDMEMFSYEIRDFDLAEKIHGILKRKALSKNFKDLLDKHLELQEKWIKYRYNIIKNETINWLCENNIELENQQLIPEMEIKEMSGEEIKNLPEELKGFGPFACLNCHNKEGLKARWFTLSITPENMLVEKEIQRIMKEKFDINHHGNFGGGKQEFLTAARCPKCGGEAIFWDY